MSEAARSSRSGGADRRSRSRSAAAGCPPSASSERPVIAGGTAAPSSAEHGGRDVDSCAGAATRVAGPRAAGQLHQQRHLDRLAVEEDAVLVLAVLAQPLAVVGEQDDQRAVVDPELSQLGDQVADHRVGGGDLAVVGGLAASAGEGLGAGVYGVCGS